jgi:hypothetical protein
VAVVLLVMVEAALVCLVKEQAEMPELVVTEAVKAVLVALMEVQTLAGFTEAV